MNDHNFDFNKCTHWISRWVPPLGWPG